MAGKHYVGPLTLLYLLLLINGRPELDPSDLKAFYTIHKDLGVNGQPSATPCNSHGVFCERRRISMNNTYMLKITRLVFKSQKLSGFLSPAIGLLDELKELSISNNKIVDQVPPQIVDCRKLEVLDLGNNRLSGKVPSELSSLINLRILNLSSNRFSGSLAFLKYFPNLETLSISNNTFSGKIPRSVKTFRNLRSFDYNGNYFLQDESSAVGYPNRFILAEIEDNKNSAAAPGSSRNAQSPVESTTSDKKHKSKAKKIRSWILGFFAGAVAGLISGFVFSILMRMVWRAIKGGKKDLSPVIFSSQIKKEQLEFLQKEDGLASLEMIGKGGCGEVYKAVLQDDSGKTIAIKKIIQNLKDETEITAGEDSRLLNSKLRQIRSEINTVGQIRHRNLLSLWAHVPRPDCHYLVYEFMKNGSLQDALNQVSEGKAVLDWITRHRIALGVAAGLEYLHMHHKPRIIHRDLKPANILLDDDMEARIADFGLAKAMPDAYTHVTASNIAGTVGYIAPEYHQTLKFTDKCDIYSFGVMLGVLVVGKLPSDDFFQNTAEMSLIRWMRNVMTSENPSQAIDEKLTGNGFEEQMLLVLKIACFCTQEDPKQRPNSKDVRCMLSQIEH